MHFMKNVILKEENIVSKIFKDYLFIEIKVLCFD